MHLWFRIASLPDLHAVSSRRSASSERLRRQNVFAFVACAIRLARLSPCGPRTLPGAFLRNGPRNVHVFVAFPTHVIISKTMSYMLQQNCCLVHSNGPFISMASSIVMKPENVYVSKVRKHPFTCKKRYSFQTASNLIVEHPRATTCRTCLRTPSSCERPPTW